MQPPHGTSSWSDAEVGAFSRTTSWQDTTWLIAAFAADRADALADTLRALGARAHVVDTEGRDLQRLSGVDAQLLLLPDGQPSEALCHALRQHPGLRWVTPIVAEPTELRPHGEGNAPDVDALRTLLDEALAPDQYVRAYAEQDILRFLVDLAELGPARLMRALANAREAAFIVQLTRQDADAHLAISKGMWVGASYQSRTRRGSPLTGLEALRRVLELEEAGCLVLRVERLKPSPDSASLDAALASALTAAAAPTTPRDPISVSGPARLAGPEAVSSAPTPATPNSSVHTRQRSRGWGLAALGVAVGAVVAAAAISWLREPKAPPSTARSTEQRERPREAPAVRVEPLRPAAAPKVEPLAPEGPDGSRVGAPTAPAPTRARAPAVAGSRSGARHAYERALRQDPRDPHAHMGLAHLMHEAGDPEQARPHAESAVALRPTRFGYRMLLGHLLLQMHEPEGALKEFRAALDLRPDSWAATKAARQARRAANATTPR